MNTKDDSINTKYPSNSKRIRYAPTRDVPDGAPTEQKKLERVTTSAVLKKKKGFVERVSSTFLGDDAKSVGSYILWDVLIPAAKSTISEMVSTGIEMLLFGEARGGSKLRRERDRTIVNYNSLYSNRSVRARSTHEGNSEVYYRNRATHRFDDIIIATRGEAEEVLSSLVDQIDTYDVATVADFYDLIGATHDFSDNKYGWTNLNRATVVRTREGYILDLPKPLPLD